MTLRREYSLGKSKFNAFLHAVVGEEKSGQELTVLSALARRGLDPWGEAARLSEMPREAAVRALAETLANLPKKSATQPQDKLAIAGRLVDCLPRRGEPAAQPAQAGTNGPVEKPRPAAPRNPPGLSIWVMGAGLCVVVLLALVWLYANKSSETESSIPVEQHHQSDTAASDIVQPNPLDGSYLASAFPA